MRFYRQLALAILLALAVPRDVTASAVVEAETWSVEVSPHGVLTRVPDDGIVIVDGPSSLLDPGFVEWFGVAYDGPSGRVEAVGLGKAGDWSGRRAVRPVSFSSTTEQVTAVTRAGDLEIRTVVSVDPEGILLVRVTLTNVGRSRLENVRYSREWRSQPGEGFTFADNVDGLRDSPVDVVRHVRNPGGLEPGSSSGLTFSFSPPGSPVDEPVEVPLALWTAEDHPTGLEIGEANAISWGDFDADGDIDMFALQSGHLWRNVERRTWELADDLSAIMPASNWRYGASFADYDNDGLPDIGTEPRLAPGQDDRMHLLKNLGDGVYVDVAGDWEILDEQPWGNSETLCWGDVDGDGNLDAFLPVYPDWEGGPGNFFLHNLGPTGPGGDYRFTEVSAAAGLDNPPGTARPEGAQLADVDRDGDIDLFSNGTLYRNVSTPGIPAFEALDEIASGVGLADSLDEGAMFLDYDMDGDLDLFVVYTDHGVRIWESYGDGSFFAAEPGIVEQPFVGLNLGMSAADWDNDGDVDFTTRRVFRRNMLVEEGVRRFTVAEHGIPKPQSGSAIPSWGDWDLDGDLDCALANWGGLGRLFENTTYDAETPAVLRRDVRVRLVRDSASVPRGLETEYGASARLELLGAADGLVRTKFVASSHGYLNQNEYGLHFALPPQSGTTGGEDDLRFDLSADYPGAAAAGLWRVNRHVNPVLEQIALEELDDRQIEVRRCGGVVRDGISHPPRPLVPLVLQTTTGGLVVPQRDTSLAPPVTVPGDDWFVGIAFHTVDVAQRVRIEEILLDGALAGPEPCNDGAFNLAIWDVTELSNPVLVAGGAMTAATTQRNRRSYLPADILLPAGRQYRLVARVSELRGTPVDALGSGGALGVLGGLSFSDVAPCSGERVAAQGPDPTTAYVALRYRLVPDDESLDPLAGTLRLGKGAGGDAVLSWADLPAAGYAVRRCSPDPEACVPAIHATGTGPEHTDDGGPLGPGESVWYRVEALSGCLLDVLSD